MDPNQPQTFTPQYDGGQSFGEPKPQQPNEHMASPQPFEQPQHQHHEQHHYDHAQQGQPHHEAHFAQQPASSFQAPFPTMPPMPAADSNQAPSFHPSTPPATTPFDQTVQSQPVVKVLSPFGIEYVFLALSLFFGAGGLIAALLILVNGAASFSALAFPAAMLLVTLPVFAFLFLRLKKLEMRMPHLRLDASKRRTTQLIQIVSFITVIISLISFVYAVFAKMAGQSGTSVGKVTLDTLCFVVVAGGVLAYYWRQEHINRSF